jgi:hypothetical protein
LGDRTEKEAILEEEQIIRRETEPVFSMQDMKRFARYLSDGKHTEQQLNLIFYHWTQNRYKWIKG